MTNVVSVSIPASLLDQAHALGINVSKVSREALVDAIKQKEKEIDTPKRRSQP